MLTQLWKSFDVGTFKIITCSTVFQPNKKKSFDDKYMIKLEFPTGLKAQKVLLGKYVFCSFSRAIVRN